MPGISGESGGRDRQPRSGDLGMFGLGWCGLRDAIKGSYRGLSRACLVESSRPGRYEWVLMCEIAYPTSIGSIR